MIVLPHNDDVPGIGGGSFWRLPDDPSEAEVSFTVADAFQGQGAGTILLAAMWLHASQIGIRFFIGHVLEANLAMRSWWDALGASAIQTQRGWKLQLSLDRSELPESPPAARLQHWLSTLDGFPSLPSAN